MFLSFQHWRRASYFDKHGDGVCTAVTLRRWDENSSDQGGILQNNVLLQVIELSPTVQVIEHVFWCVEMPRCEEKLSRSNVIPTLAFDRSKQKVAGNNLLESKYLKRKFEGMCWRRRRCLVVKVILLKSSSRKNDT